MHVCHLITGLNQAGAQNLLFDLIQADDTVDHSVCYLVEDPDLGTSAMVPQFQAAGIDVHSLGVASFLDIPLALREFHSIVSECEVDIVHLHLTHAILAGRLVVLLHPDTAVVTTHHNVPDPSPLFRNVERVTRFIDDATVAVSDGVAAAFRDVDPLFTTGSIDHVVYNGIDVAGHLERVGNADVTEVFNRHGIDEGNFVYLNVARYVTQKRQAVLIQAMDRLPKCSHLLLVGSGGDQEKALRQLVEKKGISHRVSVTGRVKSIYPYYAAADVFVLPSSHEGLPITLIEAMASKLPVVATDIPGVAEMVLDGETGILVPVDDNIALFDAMRRLRNADDQKRFGRRGYKRAESRYDIKETLFRYMEIYRKITSTVTPATGDKT